MLSPKAKIGDTVKLTGRKMKIDGVEITFITESAFEEVNQLELVVYGTFSRFLDHQNGQYVMVDFPGILLQKDAGSFFLWVADGLYEIVKHAGGEGTCTCTIQTLTGNGCVCGAIKRFHARGY